MTARLVLGEARERIDALNVFPVADGDTGTNMYLTMDGALDFVRGQFELGAGTSRLDEGLALIARGMLLSARGNSGVILSQLTLGLARSVRPETEAADPEDLAAAFETAAQTAWDALAEPVEGTILSVARAAAGGARGVVDSAPEGERLTVLPVVSAALHAAQEALTRTPDQLEPLRVAGVVDAGGAGLVLVIEALEAVLEDRPHLDLDDVPDWWVAPAEDDAGATSAHPHHHDGDHVSCEGEVEGVEVMYLLTGTDPTRAERLRIHLSRLGDSVVVAGGPADYRVHVHLEDPRLAVEAGTFAGRVEQVRITSLADGSDLEDNLETPPPTGAPVGVVACGLGEGVRSILERAGAHVVPSGPRRRASAGQLLAAMWASGAPHVVVLPNDSDTIMVANAAAQEARSEELRVDVVPTRTLVEGIAALAVLDPEAASDDVAPPMAEAARGCRSAALTRAERSAETAVGPCRPGQWLGILDEDIICVDDDLAPAARAVLERLLTTDDGGAEVLTIVRGKDARPEELASVLAEMVQRHTGIEVLELDGGQPTYPYLLGAE